MVSEVGGPVLASANGVKSVISELRVIPVTSDQVEAALDGQPVVVDVRTKRGSVLGTIEVSQRIRELAAAAAPDHPSLGWQVNGTLLAHRRRSAGLTVCGREGELTVAEAGVPPCPKCYQG